MKKGKKGAKAAASNTTKYAPHDTKKKVPMTGGKK